MLFAMSCFSCDYVCQPFCLSINVSTCKDGGLLCDHFVKADPLCQDQCQHF